MSVNFAEATHFGLSAPEDFTGDSFYTTSIIDEKGQFIDFENAEQKEKAKNNNPNKTIIFGFISIT